MKSVSGLRVASFLAFCWSTSALAGEDPLYSARPEWIEPIEVKTTDRSSATPFLLIDQQARIEKGQLWSYLEMVVALDTPQALTQFGTLTANWLPDKGDLIVHKIELIRGDETVDLLGQGAKFDVLRREKTLESRMLTGQLTATMPLSGAKLGDVLRLAYTVTVSDQALGDHVQWESGLITKPFPLADGRVVVSWPKSLPVSRKLLRDTTVEEPFEKSGYYYWSTYLPVAEPDETPNDAPYRFQLPPAMQVTTYSGWEDLSRSMAPLYDMTGAIEPDGELAAEVSQIAAASDDPLARAAMALESVQDNISYLLNGLYGGNYLPQMPQETWERRYGDCKAKSVLLNAILRELGIESEVVLVRSSGGDAMPALAPMPANFDHMIVRAVIGGKTYWLDGTVSGTRLDTIDEVPRFSYALPLRAEGSGLVRLDQRPQSTPDRVAHIALDQSAGILLPALVDAQIELRGTSGAPWQILAKQGETKQISDAVKNLVNQLVGDTALTEHSLKYDGAAGVATITAKGVLDTPWNRERAVYRLDAPAQAARDVGFDGDRARADWREIPLRLNSPIYYLSDLSLKLPEGRDPFTIDGSQIVSEVIGGVELTSNASLDGRTFTLSQSLRSLAEELPAAEISPAKRSLARMLRTLPVLQSGKDVRQPWEYLGKDAKPLEPLRRAYDALVADAPADDNSALVKRAGFYGRVFDYRHALEDVDAALALEEAQWLYSWRGYLRNQVGDLEGALADYRQAEMLDPNGSTYSTQIELLSLLGHRDEAVALAKDYQGLGENEMAEDLMMATALGWSGDPEAGYALLSDQELSRPGDGVLLNAMCWLAGTWNIVDAQRLETCTDAVEKGQFASGVLDSRALAYFRMGELDKAKADLDSALLLEPGQAESRLLRGIVRLAKGDKGGRDEVELALAMRPSLAKVYKAWGLEF